MRTLLVVVAAVLTLTVAAPTAAAPDDVCGDPDIASLAVLECTDAEANAYDPYYQEPSIESLQALAAASEAAMPSPAELPAYCRVHANAYFYASDLQWTELGEHLRANASPCVDYWIAITGLAADHANPRCLQDDIVRALGPRFHVMAELHFTAWNRWWTNNHKTPREAGLEFVRRWKECGYLQPGETWALNEMHSGIRRNVPGARDNMIAFLDAVREASGTKGVVWTVGFGQGTQNFSEYKPQLEEWLQDAHFWNAMREDVDAWAQEAYPDMRYWGVADASRNARTDALELYAAHPLLLAESGPAAAEPAADYLRQTYFTLGGAAWQYTSGFGYTLFSAEQMQRFVSEQVFATRHFSLTRPHAAPDGRIAFAWAPSNSCSGSPCIDPKLYNAGKIAVLDRLAAAIRESYERGGGSQMGACGEPGAHIWCKDADVPDATFNPLWETFLTW